MALMLYNFESAFGTCLHSLGKKLSTKYLQLILSSIGDLRLQSEISLNPLQIPRTEFKVHLNSAQMKTMLFIELLKQIILLHNFQLSRNEHHNYQPHMVHLELYSVR